MLQEYDSLATFNVMELASLQKMSDILDIVVEQKGRIQKNKHINQGDADQ